MAGNSRRRDGSIAGFMRQGYYHGTISLEGAIRNLSRTGWVNSGLAGGNYILEDTLVAGKPAVDHKCEVGAGPRLRTEQTDSSGENTGQQPTPDFYWIKKAAECGETPPLKSGVGSSGYPHPSSGALFGFQITLGLVLA